MAMRWFRNVWANAKALVDLGILTGADFGPPTNGVTGTGVGFAGLGSSYVDASTGTVYRNTGTKASPVWTVDAAAIPTSVLGGIGSVAVAKMTYDFTVDGGAQTAIVPANSPTLPINAIILGGTVDVTVALVGAGSVSLGTTAGSSAVSLKAATAAATYAVNSQQPIIPIFTAATYLKLTAAGRLNMTVTVGTITAGRFDLQVVYIIGN